MSKLNGDVGMKKVDSGSMVCRDCNKALKDRMDICLVFPDHKPPRVFGGKSCPFHS